MNPDDADFTKKAMKDLDRDDLFSRLNAVCRPHVEGACFAMERYEAMLDALASFYREVQMDYRVRLAKIEAALQERQDAASMSVNSACRATKPRHSGRDMCCRQCAYYLGPNKKHACEAGRGPCHGDPTLCGGRDLAGEKCVVCARFKAKEEAR